MCLPFQSLMNLYYNIYPVLLYFQKKIRVDEMKIREYDLLDWEISCRITNINVLVPYSRFFQFNNNCFDIITHRTKKRTDQYIQLRDSPSH